MQQFDGFRQMMEFQRSAFDNVFNAMVLFQEMTEKVLTLSLEQATLLAKEGKKAAGEGLKAWREGSDTLKKAMDEGWQKMAAWCA